MCPDLCMCIEGHLCNSCAVSSSRMYVMQEYGLQPDPCDYQLIRFNNSIQMLSCVCDVAALIVIAIGTGNSEIGQDLR